MVKGAGSEGAKAEPYSSSSVGGREEAESSGSANRSSSSSNLSGGHAVLPHLPRSPAPPVASASARALDIPEIIRVGIPECVLASSFNSRSLAVIVWGIVQVPVVGRTIVANQGFMYT